jgi:RNA polymerase sigma-70 factor (ECF subfamily)
MRITLNLSRNRRRSVARYLSAVERWFRLEGRTMADATSETEGLAASEARSLRAAVDRLGRVDREIVYLRYFLGQGEADAAATLGVPIGTVKSRLSRALGRLRGVVEAEYPELREVLKA